jgi:iron complex outermembrane recepter protein
MEIQISTARGRIEMRMTLKALTATSALCATLAAPIAFAQEQARPAGADNAGTTVGLAEIVVTAQKRAESAQKAAIAITTVSSDALVRAGVTDSQQLTNLAPSLQISSSYGPTNNFYLRGVGNAVENNASDPAVIVNLDGVPIGRPTGVQGLFFDLKRLEVLKGPQGTLYGRNATGGAINVITAPPELGQTSGYADFTYGNYNTVKADVAANVPVDDKTAIRVATMLSRRDGTYSDGTGDEDLRAVRVSLASKVSDTLKITVSADYAHQGGKGSGATLAGLNINQRIGVYDPRLGAALSTVPAVDGLPFPAGFVPFLNFSGAQNGFTFLQPYTSTPFMDNNFWGVRLQADLDTALGTVSFIPAYRSSRLNYLSTSGPTALSYERDTQGSAELRLVSPSSNRLQYVFGLFYFNERDYSQNEYNFQYLSYLADIAPHTDSFAGYGRLTYSITPKFRLSGGARYTIDKRSEIDNNDVQQIFCTVTSCLGTATLPVSFAPVNTTDYNASNPGTLIATHELSFGDRTFRKATWRVGSEYDVGLHSLLYATAESGYKSGGFFATPDPTHNSFGPESMTAFTIGSKNRFLANRLQVNLEAFWWKYSNQQVSHFFDVGSVPVFGTDNIGKSRYRGIEVETLAQVSANTNINATVQYLDARDTSFTYTNSVPPNTGCPVSQSGGQYVVDCSGRRPSNAPVWTVQGGITQHVPLGEHGDLTLAVDSRYQSESYTGIELLQAEIQKGFTTTNLSVEYTSPGKTFSISGFVNNVENNTTIGFSQTHSIAPGLVFYALRLPRMYGARFGFKF